MHLAPQIYNTALHTHSDSLVAVVNMEPAARNKNKVPALDDWHKHEYVFHIKHRIGLLHRFQVPLVFRSSPFTTGSTQSRSHQPGIPHHRDASPHKMW